MDPLSWQALQAVAQQLATIRKTNGYLTDIGQQVTLETIQITELESPTTGIVAGDFTPGPNQTRRTKDSRMAVTIECTIPANYASAQYIAHCAMEDIPKAITETAEWLPDGVRGFTMDAMRLLQRPDGAPIVVAQFVGSIALTKKITITQD